MKKFYSPILFFFYFFAPIALFGQTPLVTDLDQLNEMIDTRFANLRDSQKPVIGISAVPRGSKGSAVPGSYLEAIKKAGGIPLIIPVTEDGSALYELLDRMDGLLMTGGSDVAPSFYKEEKLNETVEIDTLRDVFDLMLIKMAADRNIPILGICRGNQLLNVAFGGSLYQDLPVQRKDSNINHKQTESGDQVTHSVVIRKGTGLTDIIGKDTLPVNTFHHQAIKTVAPSFKITAVANDGVIEGIESDASKTILGVQWHPELLVDCDSSQLGIYKWIVGKSILYKQAKEIHRSICTLDTHADTPLRFVRTPGFDFSRREKSNVNLPKMKEGMLDGIFLAAYIGQGKRDESSTRDATLKIDEIIDSIYSQVNRNIDLCRIAQSRKDLVELKEKGKKAIFIGIENGYPIGKDIGNLRRYKARGVGYITLCHTRNNDICDSSSDSIPEWGGLSPFGYKVIKEMNRLGMVIDLSHTHEKTFWDVLKVSKAPVVVTHSSVRALCNTDRNLTDEQMKALAAHGGVMQLCPVDEFVKEGAKKVYLDEFIDHIDYAVNLIGIDHVGIGSDFDGGGGLIGLRGANDMINITIKLLERGYTKEQIAKIWGGNFLRLLDEVQAKKKR